MKGKRGHIDPHQKKVLSKSPTLFVLTAIHSYFYHSSKACNGSVCVHCVRDVTCNKRIVLKNRYSQNLCEIPRKASLPGSPFNKVADLQPEPTNSNI